jgi:glutamate-1-semialdehyde aminotransferase
MIIEPIMMNAGIIKPERGYLSDLRNLLHRHRALLTFDEIKTGLTVGPGGSRDRKTSSRTSSPWSLSLFRTERGACPR